MEKTFMLEVEYPHNFRFLEVVAADLQAAKQLIRAREDHHDRIVGMRAGAIK